MNRESSSGGRNRGKDRHDNRAKGRGRDSCGSGARGRGSALMQGRQLFLVELAIFFNFRWIRIRIHSNVTRISPVCDPKL